MITYRFKFASIPVIGLLLCIGGCISGPPETQKVHRREVIAEPAANAYYYYTEAQILKNRGDTEAALEMMRQAVERDPETLFVRRELATLYIQNKQEALALELLQAILQDAPDDIPTLLLTGRLYQNRKELEKAKTTFEAVLNLDPGNKNIYLLLGNLYMQDAQWDEAFRVFEKMTEKFPDAYAGFFFMGKIHKERGDMKQAEQAFLQSLAIEPKLEGARFELIDIYAKASDSAASRRKVIRLYQEILDEDPGNARANLGLASYYHRTGSDQLARRRLQEMADATPENDLVRHIFRLYLEPGHNRDAVFLLEEILRARSDFGSLHYLLGLAYNELEEDKQAISHFEAVPADSRFYRDAVIQQAFYYSENGQTEAAIALLKEALGNDPDHPDYLIYLASLYEEKEAFEEALVHLKRAVEIAPENERAYFRLGVVYDKMDRKEDSIAAMRRVLAINPDHANALNYLGYTYADLGTNLMEAEKLIRRALALKPNDGYITDSLGWVYYKQERYAEALVFLLKAVELVADDPIILEHVGDTYRKLEDPAKALEFYRRSLSIRDKDKDAIIQKIEALENQRP